MRDDNARLFSHVLDGLHDLMPGLCVERRGDLVEEQNVSPLRDTSCKGDPLLFAAGKPIAALTRAISSGMVIAS